MHKTKSIVKTSILISCGVFSSCSEKIGKTPNIVLILADDQGWGDLSIHGNKNLKTPNIDAIAQNGAQFTNFYVCAVSSPTRAELLTGRYHVRAGVYSTSAGGERMNSDEVTIADILKKNGYKTAAFGKWHNGMQFPYHPNAKGFDEFYGFCSGHWGNYFDPMLEHNGKITNGKGFIIDDLTNKAIEYISDNKENPFFVYLPYNTPHSPMMVPDEYWKTQRDKGLISRHKDPQKEDTLFTKAALALVENIDYNVGRIINHIKKLNLEDNTIVIYMSDNGPNGWRYNGGMKGKKGWVTEGGVRSPLFIMWNGKIKKGLVVDEIASDLDIFPTLIDLTKIEYEPVKKLDGVSLEPLLFERNYTNNERAIVNYWNGWISTRYKHFRLDHENKLFNIDIDRGQEKDVSKEYPEIAKKMIKIQEDWKSNVLTELPKEDNRPFIIGHPDAVYTQLPARDAMPHGNIKRSNKYPNSSYFCNWIATTDSITWDVEVMDSADYQVEIYYNCNNENIGSNLELIYNSDTLNFKLTSPHTSELIGIEDRTVRKESMEQHWNSTIVGNITLNNEKGKLILKATNISYKDVMDFRLLTLKKVN